MHDAIVYLDPDHTHYVANEDGQWVRWPAVAGGWQARRRVSESAAEGCAEIADQRLADLAFRLAGRTS
jgi:hypothetical protein